MKNRSTQVALLLMLAISVFASCSHTKNKNGNPEPITPAVAYQDNEAEVLEQEECDSTNINIAIIDIPGDVKVNIHRGKSMLLEMDGVSLSAPDTAIIRKGTYTVTALTTEELPPLADEMVNVTFGSGNGYRFLPNGEHFSPYAELRMAYDESKLPHGYTPDDIYTSYYDEEKKTWVRLFRKEIDTVNKEIVSLTTHFTDFVNEILKAPEMPETQAFVPTMMTDLEAANPLEGITMIQPPTANNMGTANLSYPLQIPAGRQGMQPNLALTYNSNGGNGWLGVGWDISIPCISVETRWGVPRYEPKRESESYLLNGEQLVMKGRDSSIYLPHRNSDFILRSDTTEQRFYPRIDETKDSIVRHGTSPQNYWWSVTDRAGITHYYGKKKGVDTLDTESVLRDICGNIAKWMLTESIDPNGNTVRYYYEITKPQNILSLGKTIYPSSIEYTGHYDEDSIYHSGKYEIRFNRQGIVRPDIITSCNYGFEEVIDAILCNVTVAYDDKPFRLYQFHMHNTKQTLYKTILNRIIMIDSIMCGEDLLSILANNYCDGESLDSINLNLTCARISDIVENSDMGNYISDKVNYSVVEHTFEYNTAPENVFSEQIVEINDLNDVGLTFPERLKGSIELGYNLSELGFTIGKGWNIGGGAGLGLDPVVAITTSSAGLSYNYGSSKSESKLTLIDIDGDGYQDKVYVINNKIHYCKRINHPDGTFSYADKKCIKELSNVGTFMKEKSHSHTLSGQLNFFASVNLSETWTTSYTENYFSDVNADGLPDLVTDDGVYFNNTDSAGNVSFFMQPNKETGVDTISTNLMNCGSMIYDGELNDSIYCNPVETTKGIETNADKVDSLLEANIKDGWSVTSITPLDSNNSSYLIRFHKIVLDCDTKSTEDENLVSMGNTEAVKVWVAPKNGEIKIVSKIRMFDTTGGLKLSRYADGVSYKVQHDRINYFNVTDTAFSLLNSVIIDDLSGTLTKDDTSEVNKTKTLTVNQGDIIYFRLLSNSTHYYDHVEWVQSIRYTNLDNSEDTYGKPKNQYNSYEDFIVSGKKYFQAIDNGYLNLTIDVNVGQLKSRAKLRIYKNASVVFDEFLRSDMGDTTFYKNFYVEKDAVVIIIITDDSLSNKTTFGNIVCKPHYNFTPANNSVIKGSVEYDIPAYYHVNTNIKPIYTNIFGPLYRGWGQFTYNPKDHDNLINIADLRPMTPVDSSEVPEIEDSIVSPENIDTTNMSLETFNDIVESKGINLVSTDAKYYVMEGNSKHWLWYGPANTTMITATQMSNTIRTDIYSTMEDVEIVRDCPASAPTTEYPSVKTHSKTSKSSNFNRNYSGDFGIYTNLGFSRNSGSSEIIADFMDMNGDRYPDLIASIVQYTKPSGGLNHIEWLNSVSTSDATNSEGHEKGGSGVVGAYLHNRKNQTANRSETTGSALDNVSANVTTGVGSSKEILVDINGDGLPDKITESGDVYLNWGYKFMPTLVDWLDEFKRKSVFITGGLNYSNNNLFNICQFSIGGGVGINYSHNETEKMLIDINGDGLPDRIEKMNDTTLCVMYNIGNGRWKKIDVDIPDIIRSYSLSHSINASGTIGFTLFGAKITCSLNGSPYNNSCTVDKVQLADFNNDGLPDFVTSDGIGTIKIRYNQLGGVNLLRKVTNPIDGTIKIDYNFTESSINNPHRQWVMEAVTVDAQNSPIGGSVMKTGFEYSNPYYDRYERTGYGFEKVTTRQYKSNNTVYRYTEECYNNKNYALKGKKKSEALFDGTGKKYTETLYDMEIRDPKTNMPIENNCDIWVAPIITVEINNFYEGQTTAQLTTMISYDYDKYQNIASYRNWGDTTFTDDDIIVNIVYYSGMSHNMVGLKKDFTIKSIKNNKVMRHYGFDYNEQGKLIIEKIYNNDVIEAVYDMSYDSRGNVQTFKKPADENGNRQNYYYTYDTLTYTYPTSITDAFNLMAIATYDYRFGVPLEKTDPAGNRMVYTYDYRGRTKTITGPKELAANKPYTIFMKYYPTEGTGQNEDMGANRDFPYSITYHYDQQHPNDNIETVVICDNIGRVIQTKKDAVVNGVSKTMVSGKIILDEFGRTIKQYQPFSENFDTTYSYNGTFVSGSETTTTYDIMDRQTSVIYPYNDTTTMNYSIAQDYSNKRRFLTKTTDPLNRTTSTYTDYAGKTTEIIDALNGSTRMRYDCLHQLIETTDPEGYVTMYEYDNMGRMTQRIHPDAGSTKYEYNPAGQPTRKIMESGDYITYKYDLNRLIEVQYSKYPQNNVLYTYGSSGNSIGRITKIQNNAVMKYINYGNMGEVVEEIKVFAIPTDANVYVFRTAFEYDSWNRVQNIMYSDGEEVHYKYDCGGNLLSMHGIKDNTTTPYIKEILYNDQGKRNSILYGNGVKTDYRYDLRMRLDSLICNDNSSNTLQKIKYTYDNVDNIISVNNATNPVGILGGSYQYLHEYDMLNRLESSSGTYNNTTNGIINYNCYMKYTPAGKLDSKTNSVLSQNLLYVYCAEDKPHAPRRILNTDNGDITDFRWDQCGNLGQVDYYNHDGIWHHSRHIGWTEDNRITNILDNYYHSYYAYDESGERVLKLTGKNNTIDINADKLSYHSILKNVTLYTSPYLVVNNKGYTKHFYAGNERICAAIGEGNLSAHIPSIEQYDVLQDSATMSFYQSIKMISDRALLENRECLNNEDDIPDKLLIELENVATNISVVSDVNVDVFRNTMIKYSSQEANNSAVFYYHSDHLGSASWITNGNGTPVQHLQYMPYGEPFVNERTSSYNERFTFTGKERDSETGFSYFGARYYDSDLMTAWLSVDPMADKYPGLSPYAYCAWNPVRLVDPDGEDVWEVNIITGETKVENTRENRVTVVGNGVNKSYDFPSGDFYLNVEHTKDDNGSYCSINAYGGTEYNNASLSLDYITPTNCQSIKKLQTIDGIAIPEYLTYKSPEGFGVGITATLCGVIGFSISVGYAQDGLGKSTGFFSLNYATGVEAGIGINGFAINKGLGVKDIEGKNQIISVSTPVVSGSYNFMSKDKNLGKGFGPGLKVGATIQIGKTWIF